MLVGFRAETFLLEVKEVGTGGAPKRRGKATDERGLLESQQEWWALWKGRPPIVVTTVEEAFAAIGAVVTSFPTITPKG